MIGRPRINCKPVQHRRRHLGGDDALGLLEPVWAAAGQHHAGAAAGQLEGEIARHDWFTATGDPKLIFDDDRGDLWRDAMARRTREL